MIEIKENQYGNLDITVNDYHYLNIPSSKPKSFEVIERGEFSFQYKVRLGFEWTKEEREFVEYKEDKYNNNELIFKSSEEMFAFLQKYLNRFEWND